MSRYNEISQYFNSDNSASMDVERYTHITERTISTDLKIIDKYLFVQRNIAERKNRKCWVRYYISSSDLTSEKFSNAMRSHWDV
ncbi:hypothetical protein FG656_023205, partial [Salmonella enterica subsp. enterica serovar Mbandaka]